MCVILQLLIEPWVQEVLFSLRKKQPRLEDKVDHCFLLRQAAELSEESHLKGALSLRSGMLLVQECGLWLAMSPSFSQEAANLD